MVSRFTFGLIEAGFADIHYMSISRWLRMPTRQFFWNLNNTQGKKKNKLGLKDVGTQDVLGELLRI